jgi:hypothetical protein
MLIERNSGASIIAAGVKVNVKFSPCFLTEYYAIITYGRSGGIAPLIPDLDIRWR